MKTWKRFQGTMVAKWKTENDFSLRGSQNRNLKKISSCEGCKTKSHERFQLARVTNSKLIKDFRLRGSQNRKLKTIWGCRACKFNFAFHKPNCDLYLLQIWKHFCNQQPWESSNLKPVSSQCGWQSSKHKPILNQYRW